MNSSSYATASSNSKGINDNVNANKNISNETLLRNDEVGIYQTDVDADSLARSIYKSEYHDSIGLVPEEFQVMQGPGLAYGNNDMMKRIKEEEIAEDDKNITAIHRAKRSRIDDVTHDADIFHDNVYVPKQISVAVTKTNSKPRKKICCNKLGCRNRARGKDGLCIKHGGGLRCTLSGCVRSARDSSGLCMHHGGGARCSHPSGCSKGAVGGVFCIRHGGGKRCAFTNCDISASRKSDYCTFHKKHSMRIASNRNDNSVNLVDKNSRQNKQPKKLAESDLSKDKQSGRINNLGSVVRSNDFIQQKASDPINHVSMTAVVDDSQNQFTPMQPVKFNQNISVLPAQMNIHPRSQYMMPHPQFWMYQMHNAPAHGYANPYPHMNPSMQTNYNAQYMINQYSPINLNQIQYPMATYRR